MKSKLKFLTILMAVTLASCVSRIDIPDEETPVLVVDLQMLRGAEITAKVHTSNNLNGSYPIENPEDVLITVQEVGVDETSNFAWSEENQLYEFTGSVNFQNRLLTSHNNLVLKAELVDSQIKGIEGHSRVPIPGKIVDTELVDSELISDLNGNEFWEGTVRFNFEDQNKNYPLYYHLLLNEKLQTKEIIDGETIYTDIIPGQVPYQIRSVNTGAKAVKEFTIADGLWVDLDKLDSDYVEVIIRSNYPIEHQNQSSDNIYSELFSITDDHYNYYLGLNNIESASGSLFGEPGLYRSNIEHGLGIFSTCVMNPKVINLTD